MKDLFRHIFHKEPLAKASAHGRVNLIGEHTDYNLGFVLPAALSATTTVEIARRPDRQVHICSDSLGPGITTHSYSLGHERVLHAWHDYVQGVTWFFQKRGVKIPGLEILIQSNIPLGAGVSSSAALLVALVKALRQLLKLDITDVDAARFAQKIENDFVGARVGIMDQMAASLAEPGAALFLDTKSLTSESVPFPSDVCELLIVNSGVKHSNVHGGYNVRRRECEEAYEMLGVKSLREVESEPAAFDAELPEKVLKLPAGLRARASHVISENRRVLACVSAMREANPKSMGELFKQSHISMRDDYEVSTSEIDYLVELASASDHVFGARLTGGGFGGSIVALCKPGSSSEVFAALVAPYKEKTGFDLSRI